MASNAMARAVAWSLDSEEDPLQFFDCEPPEAVAEPVLHPLAPELVASVAAPLRRRLRRKCQDVAFPQVALPSEHVPLAAAAGQSGVAVPVAALPEVAPGTPSVPASRASASDSSEAARSSRRGGRTRCSKDSKQAWDRVRNQYTYIRAAAFAATGESVSRETRDALRSQWRQEFGKLPAEELRAVVQATLEQARQQGVRAGVLRCLEARLSGEASGPKEERRHAFVDRRGCCLLTFNGPWGVVPEPALPEHIMKAEEPVPLAVEWLKDNAHAAKIWKQFLEFVGHVAKRLNLSKWSACLELSLESVDRSVSFQPTVEAGASSHPRFHLHLFMQASTVLVVKSADDLAFLGSSPYRSPDQYAASGGRGRGAAAAQAAGHYYVQAPKTTQVFMRCTTPVHECFGMRAEWVTAYWQQGKISDDAAIGEYLKVKRDCKRNIQNVKDLQAYKRMEAARVFKDATKERLAKLKKPRAYVQAVDELFLPQFENDQLFRRKFLILEGSSNVGKSEFARLLSKSPAHFIELDCTDCEHVDLRAFSPGFHDLILWDEATPQLVMKYKKLFQGQGVDCQMAQTRTSKDNYEAFPYNVKMVICSNIWSELCRELRVADYEWIQQNSIHVRVKHASDLWLP